MRFYPRLCVAVTALLFAPILADDPPAPSSTDAEAVQSTRVTSAPVEITVDLQGVLEAKRMHEISIVPEAWGQLEVIDAVAHGAKVRKGEVVIRLDREDIDEAIEELEKSIHLAKLDLRLAESSHRLATQAMAMALEESELAKKQSDEDLKYYRRVGHPLAIKSAEFALKSAESQLEYQKEELDQLEKMYKEDELTEETEEIVLKRQRDAVERGQFSLERAKINYERAVGTTLARGLEQQERQHRSQLLAWEKTRLAMPVDVEKAEIALERQKEALDEKQKRLRELVADRELLEVRSPADGIAYYGRCVRGSWSGGAQAAAKLRKGGSLLKREVPMTIVEPQVLLVRATVPEKSFGDIRNGLLARVEPAALPGVELIARVQSVSTIPVAPGSFEAVLAVTEKKLDRRLVAGMSCSLHLVPYSKPKALQVPTKAVWRDGVQGEPHVFVRKANGESERREVKLGRSLGDKTEILRGLREGDELLLERPDAAGAKKKPKKARAKKPPTQKKAKEPSPEPGASRVEKEQIDKKQIEKKQIEKKELRARPLAAPEPATRLNGATEN